MSNNLIVQNGSDSEQFSFLATLEVTIKKDTAEVVLRNPKDNHSIKLKAKVETGSNIKSEFENLVKIWKKATAHYSFIRQKIVHPAYLRIIGLGESAIPFILEELAKRPSASWFPALEAISGKDVAHEATSIDKAIQTWLNWGKQERYLKI